MADKKITQLTNITGANLVDADEFVVVDISADETKAITLGELKEAFDSGSGFVRITGDTMTGDLALSGADVTFGDNDKAIFGAGSDLEIYHDASDGKSYIRETGSGNFEIRATNLRLKTATGGNYLAADAGGAVTAYYDGSPKLYTTSTGIDVTGNATFADNGKAIFGAGSDLQIYHDGSNSYIDDAGTGDLYLRSSNDLLFTNADGSETYARFQENGYVRLFYDNALKLATTSTGVDITGTLTSDGLTVDGQTQLTRPSTEGLTLTLDSAGSSSRSLEVSSFTNSVAGAGWDFNASGSTGAVQFSTAGTSRMFVQNNGDISFYEDTGTTPKFFWDASAESLGIGTSSPYKSLTVGETDATAWITSGGSNVHLTVSPNGASGSFIVRTGGTNGDPSTTTERMRITSAGGIEIPNQNAINELTFTGTEFTNVLSASTSGFQLGTTGAGYLSFLTSNSEAMRIDSSGSLLIKTASHTPTNTELVVSSEYNASGTTDAGITLSARQSGNWRNSGIFANGDALTFTTGDTGLNGAVSTSEKMRLDGSGNLLVGTTDSTPYNNSGTGNGGSAMHADGLFSAARDGNAVGIFNRLASDGDIVEFRKDGLTKVGSIGVAGTNLLIDGGSAKVGLAFRGAEIRPRDDGADDDGGVDLGSATYRFNDIYATNGTIQTSDRNEKQDIDVLSDAEQRVAVACKGLLRKFRWIDAVAEKGDDARIHFGIIAQDLQDAFAAEGLDAGRYAMFISSTWTDEETGEERTRMGVRYSELLAFIIAAI